jgi:hypothetical protein
MFAPELCVIEVSLVMMTIVWIVILKATFSTSEERVRIL